MQYRKKAWNDIQNKKLLHTLKSSERAKFETIKPIEYSTHSMLEMKGKSLRFCIDELQK